MKLDLFTPPTFCRIAKWWRRIFRNISNENAPKSTRVLAGVHACLSVCLFMYVCVCFYVPSVRVYVRACVRVRVYARVCVCVCVQMSGFTANRLCKHNDS